jgi:hypothetical protein
MKIIKTIQEIYLENGNRLLRKESTRGEIIWNLPNGHKLDSLTATTIESIYQSKFEKKP